MSAGLKILSAIVGLTGLLACSRIEDDAPQQPAELESAGSLEAEFVSATASTASFEYDLSIHPDAGKSFRAGILYSTSRRFTASSAMRAVIENPVDGTGVLTLEGLSFATRYYYATYVYRLGKYEISEVKDFTTELVQVDMEEGVQYSRYGNSQGDYLTCAYPFYEGTVDVLRTELKRP